MSIKSQEKRNAQELFILLGSNLGDKMRYIESAQKELENELGKLIHQSSVYESQAWGFECNSNFYNKVIVVKCDLEPAKILDITQKIEKQLGRTAKSENNNYTSRTIDIDILFYGSEIINAERLVVPHPQIQNRKFTLLPLAEICSEFIHPILNKTIAELVSECEDNCWVRKI